MPTSKTLVNSRISLARVNPHRLFHILHRRVSSGRRPQEYSVLTPALCNAGNSRVLIHRQSQLRTDIHGLLIILFGVLHTADGILTYLGLRFTSVIEVNPVLNYAVDLMGLGLSIFLLKLACLGVIAFLFSGRSRIKSCWSTAALTSAVYFYCWVVSNNLALVSAS